MPGKLVKNLRSGHSAEDLGIMFLRNFCAVAQVRQEDDMGIDAIATLLREERGLLYGENTFFVQVKSSSLTQITYKNDEIDWFVNQDLPLFICSVNREEDNIKIFTTNPGFQILPFKSANRLQLNLTDEDQNFFNRHEKVGDLLIVDIGPPIIVSGYEKSINQTEKSRLYSLLKIWVEEEYKQSQLRKIGFSLLARWDKEGNPDYYGKIVTGNTNYVLRDLMAAKPFLEYLSNHIEWNSNMEEYKKDIMRGLKKWYKECGIDISLNVDKKILHSDDKRQIYTD